MVLNCKTDCCWDGRPYGHKLALNGPVANLEQWHAFAESTRAFGVSEEEAYWSMAAGAPARIPVTATRAAAAAMALERSGWVNAGAGSVSRWACRNELFRSIDLPKSRQGSRIPNDSTHLEREIHGSTS
jgi:hypothetical protein